MPLTAEQAAKQIAAEIKARENKWNPGNVLDATIGVAVTNAPELQNMLNDLLKKKGILSTEQEAAVQQLLDQQAAERRQRQKTRTRHLVVISVVAAIIGGVLYWSFKK